MMRWVICMLCVFLGSFSVVWAQTAQPDSVVVHEGQLLELYDGMTAPDRHDIDAVLDANQMNSDDLADLHYTIKANKKDGATVLHTELEHKGIDDSGKKRSVLMKLGVGYLYPIGTTVEAKAELFNSLKGKTVISFDVLLSSTMNFSLGSANYANVSANVYLGRTGIYIGPLFQLIYINNPLIDGKQNFVFHGQGINAGIRVDFKVLKQPLTLDIRAYGAYGGLNRNPKPFLNLGAGATLLIPLNRK